MDLIIHHAKCPDGWCAAFIAHKKYPEAEILGLDHGEPIPYDAIHGKDVLVLDYSWPTRELNIELNKIAKSFHIYDHHKTALERLEGLDFATFDMKRSGAGLAWDFLFGKNAYPPYWASGARWERPWWVDYVEDRDLWNHALPNTKAINAYIMSLPMTVGAWEHLESISPTDAATYGYPVISHIERYVKEAVAEAQFGILDYIRSPITTGTYNVAVVNAPYMNCSEIGNVLAKQVAVGMTWFERADGQIQFSLRSEGDIDVSVIATAFGGGGHKHASGFRMTISEGRKLIDKILGRHDDGRNRSSNKVE